jgi:3-oxoacyl-[acyl-carrier protein] reductase
MFSLAGKNALVCGATQGIGWATAQVLAQQGANLTLLARNEVALRDCLAQLPKAQGQVHDYLCADFSQTEGLKQVLDDYLLHHSSKTIHILVNNTGGPAAGPITAAEPAAFRAAFEQHLIANQLLAQALLPRMRALGFGRIINVISTSVKQPLPNLGVSNTIRAAVANWAKTLATEVAAQGITVNNVLPGATATGRLFSLIQNKADKTGKATEVVSAEMVQEIPARRFAQPKEIAAAIAFLASEEAAYITGINLPVDGGRTGCL